LYVPKTKKSILSAVGIDPGSSARESNALLTMVQWLNG